MSKKQKHIFNTNDISDDEMYKLLIGSVIPRPIAWVSSKSKDGILNLAPFSFFTVASRNPPTLLISIGPGVNERIGSIKDTLTNIREVKEYIINMVPEQLGEAMYRSSASVEPEKNEFELAGVTAQMGNVLNVPAVLEAPISIELMLDQIIPVGGDSLVLGKVKCIQIDKAIYAGNYKIAIDKWKPLASLAGDFAGLMPSFSYGQKDT
ncbi:flavin reductase family protein [Lysinibacillus fusiformis]|uniref:flavin reductase family protein n=1 Tax=Lysinibacillus fusiformis TaxID=28031 RepID=UPI0035C26AA1|nr:flavin reductase family protein [Lysinibacillus fusiformis]